MQIGLEQRSYNRQFSYRHPIDIGTEPIGLQGLELTLFDGQFHCSPLESKCNEIRRIETIAAKDWQTRSLGLPLRCHKIVNRSDAFRKVLGLSYDESVFYEMH
jgi:hypothetical protein